MVRRKLYVGVFVVLLLIVMTIGVNAQSYLDRTGYLEGPKFFDAQRDLQPLTTQPYTIAPFAMNFSSSGNLTDISSGDTALFNNIGMSLSSIDEASPFSLSDSMKSSEQRSFFFRASSIQNTESGSHRMGFLESYTEAIANSPRVHLYTRWFMKTSKVVRASYRFTIPAGYDSINVKEFGGVTPFKLSKLPKNYQLNHENACLEFISTKTHQGLGVSAGTESCEVRTW
jgi:hypothetical protein